MFGSKEKELQGAMEKQVTRNVLCSLLSGLMLITIGIFHTYMFVKFTPVYTETKCGDISATMDGLTVSPQTINLGIIIEVSCVNPNPYSIEIMDTNPGSVYVGHQREWQVGKLTVLPGSKLQEEGTGTVRVRMSAHISGPEADALVPHFLEDTAVPVRMELQFNVGVSISFGLGSWSTTAPFKKACGMNMAGLLVNQFIAEDGSSSRLGPLVCRESFDFEIPPVGGQEKENPGGKMQFAAAQVAPTEVEKGETVKNLSLGIVLFLSYSAGLILVYAAYKSFHGKPINLAWATSPSRRLALPDDRFRTLAGQSNDLELERGMEDVKLFCTPREGNLPRTPKIQTIRDISSPEEVAKLFLPSPATAAKYQRSKTCDGKLGLPNHSPTMLSSITTNDGSTRRKNSFDRSGTTSPRSLQAALEYPSPPWDRREPREPRETKEAREAKEPKEQSAAAPVSKAELLVTPPPGEEASNKRVPLIGRAASTRSHCRGRDALKEPSEQSKQQLTIPCHLHAERRHSTVSGASGKGHYSPCPSNSSRSPSRSPIRSSPPYTPPGRSPSPSDR